MLCCLDLTFTADLPGVNNLYSVEPVSFNTDSTDISFQPFVNDLAACSKMRASCLGLRLTQGPG